MKSKRAFMLFVTVLWIIAGITLIITLNQEDEEAVVETFGQINCEKLQSRFYSEGTLEENYLTRNEQTQLLENMAKQIGITKNYEISQQDTIKGLKSAEGYIRRQLAKNINLRNTPEITFILDQSIEYGVNMSKLIDEVTKKDRENDRENGDL